MHLAICCSVIFVDQIYQEELGIVVRDIRKEYGSV